MCLQSPLKKSHAVLALTASRRWDRGLASALWGPKEVIKKRRKIKFTIAQDIQEVERAILKDIVQREEKNEGAANAQRV